MCDFFKNLDQGVIEKSPKKHMYCSTFFTNVKKYTQSVQKFYIVPRINSDFFDVYKLYHQVLEYLQKNTHDIDIDKQKWILENDPDPTERRLAQEKIFEISNRRDPVNEFRDRAEKCIEEYKDICKTPIIIDFLNRSIETKDISTSLKKTSLDFITICQEFSPINIHLYPFIKDSHTESQETVMDGMYVSNIGEIERTLDHSGTYKNQKRCGFKNKDVDHNVKHFQTAIRKVQGIHKKEIPQEVFSAIDNFCDRRKIKLKKFTIFHLNDLLKLDKTLSKYYKDIHLIYRLYTGIQMINLSDVEDRLVKMYIAQDLLSNTIKLTDASKNSINATYMCCRLAQFCGRYDLSMKDFFCIKNAETIKKYDSVLERRARELGWLYAPFSEICS